MNILTILSAAEKQNLFLQSAEISFLLNMFVKNLSHSFKGMEDHIAITIEAVVILFRQLYLATQMDHVILACTSFLHAVCRRSLISVLAESKDYVINLIKSLHNHMKVQSGEENDNPFTKFRKYFSMMEEGITHPIVDKIKLIVNYLLAQAFFEPFGIRYETFFFNKASYEAAKKKYSSKTSFVYVLLDGFNCIFERLYDVYITGSWNAIIHSGTAYSKWTTTVYKVKEDIQKLHNPEATGVNYHELLNTVDTLIEQGENMVKFAIDKKNIAYTNICKLLSEIRIIKANELTRKAAQAQRRAPYCLSIYGGSGVGKSDFREMMKSFFGKLFNLPSGDEFCFTRTFSDQYWSGFRSYMWAIYLDDMAARNSNLQDDTSLGEILQINNNTGFCPPQADLCDKGKTPLKPELVVGTTNFQNLNAHVYYGNTLAILRRFNMHIRIVPKQEYSKNKETNEDLRMLDPSSLPNDNGKFPDYWEISVYKVVPTIVKEQQTGKFELYKNFTNIVEFLLFFKGESEQYRKAQFRAMDHVKMYDNITFCKEHIDSCDCLKIQNSEISYQTKLLYVLLLAQFAPLTYKYMNRYIENTGSRILRRTIVDSCEGATTSLVNMTSHVIDSVRITGKKMLKQAIMPDLSSSGATLDQIRASISKHSLDAFSKLKLESDIMIRQIGNYGDSIRSSSIKSKMGYAALCAFPAIIGLYKVYNVLYPQTQGNEMSVTSESVGARISTQDEKPNPWFRDEFIPTEMDIGRLTKSWKGVPLEIVKKTVANNVVAINVFYDRDGDRKMRPGKAICLGGQWYMTNAHSLYGAEMDVELVQSSPVQGITSNVKFKLFSDSVRFIKEKDLAFFKVTCLPPKKDITQLFPSHKYKTVCGGYLVKRSPDGEIVYNGVHNIKRVNEHKVLDLGLTLDSWFMNVDNNTQSGDCGSVLLAISPQGPMLLGIHQTGGLRNQATSILVSKEMIDLVLQGEILFSSNKPNLSAADGTPVNLQPLHQKSVFRYINGGSAHVYGSLPGFVPEYTSKVQNTILHDTMIQHGYSVKVKKPKMKGWEPWRAGVLDTVQQNHLINHSILDNCVDAFVSDILGGLSSKDLSELICLDNDATLNGLPGVQFIDKMNRNTSMGYPWRKKKVHFLLYNGEKDIWNDHVEFEPEVYERANAIIDSYLNEHVHMPVFTGSLKDEPLKPEKSARVFTGCPVDWAFIMRKYLLTFVRVFQRNKFLFEAAPGTNATSPQWEEIYQYLTKFGKDRLIAGDYKTFDKKMESAMILAAFDVIIKVLKRAGASDDHIKVVMGLAQDTAFPLVNYKGDLVQLFGCNPSGHPLTVVINSIVNALYIRYSWAKEGHDLSKFKDNVSLITYGDDNAMGVKKGCSFSHTIIANRLAEIGVIYTMADKSAVSIPHIDIKNVSFLKRTFEWNDELRLHVAKLEESSIAKMLMIGVPSTEICKEAHAISVMHSAVCEYANYGRNIFEEKRNMFIDIIDDLGLTHYYDRPFITWKEFIDNYYL